MKKAIITFAMMLCSAVSFAQHTIKTALQLVEGQNSYQLEAGKKPPVIWKYHAGSESGAILKISDYGNASLLFLKSDSTSVYGYYDYSKGIQYYPVGANDDIYVSLNSFTGQTSFSFNAGMESNDAIGHGYSQDDAVVLKEGKNYMFASKSSGATTVYLKYSATEDGVLELGTASYISSATYSVDGTSSSLNFQSQNNNYVGKITVAAGKTYTFSMTSYSTFMLDAKMTHPTIGSSFDLPFSASVGTNTLPAAAGTYWYSLDSSDKGYFSMASEGSLEGGSVKVYAGSYSSWSSPIATLNATLNGKWESSSSYNNYLICIEKPKATADAVAFSLAYEPYAIGETESNPYLAESMPASFTTGNGTDYYYAVDVKDAAVGKFLKVEATTDVNNTSTQFYVYKSGTYTKSQGNKGAQMLVESSGRYLVHVYNKENAPVGFTMSYIDPQPGDTYGTPAPAKKGNNTFNGTGTRYYSYTATLSGRMVIKPSSSNVYLSVPKSATGYDTWPTTSENGTYTVDVTKGNTYILKFTYVKDGDSFTLDESLYNPGEGASNPIVITGTSYTLQAGAVNVWLKYTAQQTGVFVMKGNLDYNYSNSIGFIKPGESSVTSISQSKTINGQYTSFYEGSVKVTKGTDIIMNVKVPNAKTGDNVEFYVRDFATGEDWTVPLVMKKNKEYTLPQTYSIPQWCKFDLKAGELSLYASIGFSGVMYKGNDNAAAETNGESFYGSYDSATGKSGKTFTITEAGTYYIKVSGTYSEGVFTASGSAMDEAPAEDTGATMRKIAAPLAEGDTKYKFADYIEGETKPLFYSYTAPDDASKMIAIAPGTATRVEYLTPDSVLITSVSYTDEGKSRNYLSVNKGETVYVRAIAADSELSFNTVISDYPEYGKGDTEADAITVADAGKYFFAEPKDERSAYLKYNAKEDGIFRLRVSNYPTATYKKGNGEAEALSFMPADGGVYLATLKVEKGNGYSFTLKLKHAAIVVSEYAKELPGSSYTNPIKAQAGENTVPKEKGDYWYAYDNPEEGNIIISSENSLPGGKVEIYGTEYQAAHGSSYADAISEEGSFNLKCKAKNKGDYFILVHKTVTTDKEDVFTLKSEGYEKGQLETDPIVINEFPYDANVEAGTTYYAIDTPADKNYFASISTAEALSSPYTYVFVYKADEKNPQQTTVRNSAEMIFEKGCRYILKFINLENKTLKYKINLKSCEPGDDYSTPLTAASGENTFASDGKIFYSYKATKTGKLTVYVSDKNINVSFPLGASSKDGERTCVKDNLTYTIDAVEGEDYIICFQNVKTGETFEISEREYEQGEDKTNPIDITDKYTFDDRKAEVWLRYTSQKAGMFTVSSDIVYNGVTTIELMKNDETSVELYLERKVGTEYVREYQGRVYLDAGDVAYIHVSADKTYPGKTVNVGLREVKTGETVDKPIVLNPGEKYTLPVISTSMPIWCKFTSEAGSFKVSANVGLNGIWYTSYEKAKTDESKMNFYAADENDYTFDCTASDAGENYFKLTRGLAMQRMSISGDVTTAISTVNADGNSAIAAKGGIMISGDSSVKVYTVSGTRVADETVNGATFISVPAGIYIVEINGNSQKIVVR